MTLQELHEMAIKALGPLHPDYKPAIVITGSSVSKDKNEK